MKFYFPLLSTVNRCWEVFHSSHDFCTWWEGTGWEGREAVAHQPAELNLVRGMLTSLAWCYGLAQRRKLLKQQLSMEKKGAGLCFTRGPVEATMITQCGQDESLD